jgi:RimJ/RimL family protein N-acetyltransferase
MNISMHTSSTRFGGNFNIQLAESNEIKDLNVTIETDHLYIRSVTEKDLSSYISLFGDINVMEKYATGQVKTIAETTERIQGWISRWQQGDPFSGLAVFKKNTDEFIGHVVLGHGDNAGESEIAYLFMKAHWHNGYGTKVVDTIVNGYAPFVIKKGFLLEGKVLEKILGTVRYDNKYSRRILKKVGMCKIGEEEKFGALRKYYGIKLPVESLESLS